MSDGDSEGDHSHRSVVRSSAWLLIFDGVERCRIRQATLTWWPMQQSSTWGRQVEALEGCPVPQWPLHRLPQPQLHLLESTNVVPFHCTKRKCSSWFHR